MKKSEILVLNGPNINMLGIREPGLYGKETYNDLVKFVRSAAKKKSVKVSFYQSNDEGALVGKIQKSRKKFDGIILNAAAYTHTSIAILDALKCASLPCVEVHITDISEREDFRKRSFVSEYAFTVIKGEGLSGYVHALGELLNYIKKND